MHVTKHPIIRLLRTISLGALLTIVSTPVAADSLREGLDALESGDTRLAFEIIEELALDGDARALAWAGHLLEHGLGTEKDEGQAHYMYYEGAQRGDSAAMTGLGRLLESGRGVDRDPHLAAQWYGRAVEAGNNDARYLLGRLLYRGNGVE